MPSVVDGAVQEHVGAIVQILKPKGSQVQVVRLVSLDHRWISFAKLSSGIDAPLHTKPSAGDKPLSPLRR